jgi:glutathione S-transferase
MAADYTLIIGNKNYSSWSMRGWLAMAQVDVPFDEIVVPLYQSDTQQRLADLSEAPQKVPVLKHGAVTIWDSLAIVEYLFEKFPDQGLWPNDSIARATARSLCAEMHSSYVALRGSVPMNVRGNLSRDLSDDTRADIHIIEDHWRRCLDKSNGPFLFGDFCAADIFYAPVVIRLRSIGYRNADLLDYCQAVLEHSNVQRWCTAACREPWIMLENE